MNALGVTFGGELTLPAEAEERPHCDNVGEFNIGRKTVTRRFFGASAGTTAAAGWMNAAARTARIFQISAEDAHFG